jgi:uncharacterized membrane protein
MTLVQYLSLYALSVPVFFAIDMLWLTIVASSFYKSQLGDLLGPVNWPVAIVFYLLYLAGLVIFVTAPALEKSSFMSACIYGAAFGFFAYATYDLTNWATLKDWPALLSIVDIAWGTFLTGTVAAVVYWLATFFRI